MELYNNTEVIVDFIANIMGQIKNLAESAEGKKEEAKQAGGTFNHGYCRVYDQSNDLMVEARIK